jgi:hypothetical protein
MSEGTQNFLFQAHPRGITGEAFWNGFSVFPQCGPFWSLADVYTYDGQGTDLSDFSQERIIVIARDISLLWRMAYNSGVKGC